MSDKTQPGCFSDLTEAKYYIATQTVSATPMSRADYMLFRGYNLHDYADGSREGYIVKEEDGTVKWLPKYVFDSSHVESANRAG